MKIAQFLRRAPKLETSPTHVANSDDDGLDIPPFLKRGPGNAPPSWMADARNARTPRASEWEKEEAAADRLEVGLAFAGSLNFLTLIAWIAIESCNLGI